MMLSYPMHLDESAIKQFIPHRDSMLFARKVTVLACDHYTGEASWEPDSFVFKGHFPDQPIVPGVMIIEAAAQIAGAGLRAGDTKARSRHDGNIGVLIAVRRCFFRQAVTPSLRLFFDLHTRELAGDTVNISGEVLCLDSRVASLDFTVAQAPAERLLGGL
jgi:3-hydroxyacyl-[acyl-carrier-protein] dehydratase